MKRKALGTHGAIDRDGRYIQFMSAVGQRVRFVPLEGSPYDTVGVYDDETGELCWKVIDIPRVGDQFYVLEGPGKGRLRRIVELDMRTGDGGGWDARAGTRPGSVEEL